VRVRTKESQLRKVVRVTAGSSVILGMILASSAMFSSVASAQTDVGQEVATATGGLSEYSLCQGVPSTSVCSLRGQSAGSEVQGAIAVDGNFEGDIFYVGGHLSNSVVLAVDNDVSGTLGISGSGNIGVYGGTNTAVLPPQGCPTTNCPVPNLVSSSSDPGLLPAFSSINSSLASYSTSLEAEAATSSNIVFDPTPNSTLILTGTASDVNVFDVEASVLEATVNLYIDVPAGSSTVINVDGDLDCSSTPCLQSVSYWNGTAYEQGGSYNSSTVESLRLNTLLNFYDATTINLDSAGPAINFLAPGANFTFNSGALFGYVYANQVNGTFEDELPGGAPTPPTTTTTTTPPVTTPPVTTPPVTTPPVTTPPVTTPPTTASTTTSTTAPTTTSTTVPVTTTTAATTTTTAATTTTTAATTTTTAATTTTTAATTTTTAVATHGARGTTTTTSETTSTTIPTTTTTVATHAAKGTTTTTTAPATTTTTTKVRATTTTTTTVPATTTTTTKVRATTTTTPTVPTTTTTVPTKTLAYTGSDTGEMAGLGLALMLVGGVVVVATSRRRPAL
jgi:choice-of-anchor A domain-containing protein